MRLEVEVNIQQTAAANRNDSFIVPRNTNGRVWLGATRRSTCKNSSRPTTSGAAESDALGMKEDSPLSGLVEFCVEDSLPPAEESFTVDDRNRDRGLTGEELPDV